MRQPDTLAVERRRLTTQTPDTELLAKYVHTLSLGRSPLETIWFFVHMYVGS